MMSAWAIGVCIIVGCVVSGLISFCITRKTNLQPGFKFLLSKKGWQCVTSSAIRICGMIEVIVVALIIGCNVGKFAPRDEKVTDSLPVMTNGCFRVSGTLTVHVVEVEKHEPQQ